MFFLFKNRYKNFEILKCYIKNIIKEMKKRRFIIRFLISKRVVFDFSEQLYLSVSPILYSSF